MINDKEVETRGHAGYALRWLRTELLGIKQPELAKLLGLKGFSYIGSVEAGHKAITMAKMEEIVTKVSEAKKWSPEYTKTILVHIQEIMMEKKAPGLLASLECKYLKPYDGPGGESTLSFRARLKEDMDAKAVTPVVLAEWIGTTTSYVMSIIQGTISPTYGDVAAIANALEQDKSTYLLLAGYLPVHGEVDKGQVGEFLSATPEVREVVLKTLRLLKDAAKTN